MSSFYGGKINETNVASNHFVILHPFLFILSFNKFPLQNACLFIQPLFTKKKKNVKKKNNMKKK